MTSLLRLSAASVSPTAILWAGTVTSTLVAICYLNTTSKTSLLEDNASTPKHAKLDVDLMDKIAEKPYLPVTKKRSVPRRLRILVIDVPEMRNEGIDGECRVNLSRVYVDGVAPPKKISGTTEVMQKSLARALVKCRHAKTHRIGVEMIEASISDLNPHNLRRTYQFGSYKYDPGKWATKTTTSDKSIVSEEPATGAEVKEKVGKKDDTNTDTTSIEMAETKPATSIVKKDGEDGGGSVLASVEDEYDAPWNQYAWIQELQLRVSKRRKTHFGQVRLALTNTCRLAEGFNLVRPWSRLGGWTDSCGEVSTKLRFLPLEKHGNGSCCLFFNVNPLVKTLPLAPIIGPPTSHMLS